MQGAKGKRIAVIVRERANEAIRMAVGLTVLSDSVSVFVMDHAFGPEVYADPLAMQSIEALGLMDVPMYTNETANPYEFMSTEDMASALLEFDIVLPY